MVVGTSLLFHWVSENTVLGFSTRATICRAWLCQPAAALPRIFHLGGGDGMYFLKKYKVITDSQEIVKKKHKRTGRSHRLFALSLSVVASYITTQTRTLPLVEPREVHSVFTSFTVTDCVCAHVCV